MKCLHCASSETLVTDSRPRCMSARQPFRDWILVGVAPGPVVTDTITRFARSRGLTVADLTGRSRKPEIAHARQELMWLLRVSTKLSYPAIGRMLGRRDHSTVMDGEAAHRRRVAA